MPVMSRVESAFCRSSPWAAFAARTVLPWALQHRPLTGDVLELGGGAGAMAERIVRQYPDVRLTCTDLDPAMSRAAADRLAAFPNASAQVADATALPYPDASFDVVVSFLMLHHVINWEQAVAEAVRVLRPGGIFVGYDLLSTPAAEWTHRLDRSPYRLIKPGEFERTVDGLSISDAKIDEGWRRHVVRFRVLR